MRILPWSPNIYIYINTRKYINHKAAPRCTMFHNKNVAAKAVNMEKSLAARAVCRFYPGLRRTCHRISLYQKYTDYTLLGTLGTMGREGEEYIFYPSQTATCAMASFYKTWPTMHTIAVSMTCTMENKRAWVGWEENFGSS